MKAVVLAAGWGTRLRPFTYTLPKHLLPVAGRPLICHVLEAIAEAGIEEVGIVVSPSTLELFRAALETHQNCQITYVLQPEPKGLAHAVLCAEGFVGKDDFLVILGDNVLEDRLSSMLERFRAEGTHLVALKEVEDPRRFGVALLNGQRVLRVVEKPREPPSNWAIVGVYAFKPSVFNAARSLRPSSRGELEITDAIQKLIDEGEHVVPYFLRGQWQDVGHPEDLLSAQALLWPRLSPRIEGKLEGTEVHGPVIVEKGALVRASRILGPAWIGPEAEVQGSALGPNVALGAKAQIRNAEVRDSIVMEEAIISEAIVEGSVLGRRAVVSGKGKASLFLGDDGRAILKGGLG